jgi:hypothetical protein
MYCCVQVKGVLNTLLIARCKPHHVSLLGPTASLDSYSHSTVNCHKDTIVLQWNVDEATVYMVKNRLWGDKIKILVYLSIDYEETNKLLSLGSFSRVIQKTQPCELFWNSGRMKAPGKQTLLTSVSPGRNDNFILSGKFFLYCVSILERTSGRGGWKHAQKAVICAHCNIQNLLIIEAF